MALLSVPSSVWPQSPDTETIKNHMESEKQWEEVKKGSHLNVIVFSTLPSSIFGSPKASCS